MQKKYKEKIVNGIVIALSIFFAVSLVYTVLIKIKYFIIK